MQVNYIQQLFGYIEQQQKDIARLKDSVHFLTNELKKIKDQPTMTVERLEYKFDQLKVENLEGTLNIGINPADLNSIEDMAITQPHNQKMTRNPEYYDDLTNKINHYIENDLESLIRKSEKQVNKSLEEPYIELIKEDIRKQIPARTDHYLNFFSTQTDNDFTEEELYHKVHQTLLADIQKAVHHFVSQCPNK